MKIPLPKSIFCMQLSALWGNERGSAVEALQHVARHF